MAGGRSDFQYTDDKGNVWALNQDTSNANVAGSLASANGTAFVPRSIKPRFAMYADQNNLRHRKVYIPTLAKIATMPATFDGGDESGTVTFTLLYTRGEKARFSRSVNTGIIP